MRPAITLGLSMLILALVFGGCATGTDGTTTSTIINILAAVLNVTSDQATAGAGSLLGLASEKLTPQDYAKVAASFPGASGLVQKAGELTGLGNHFGTIANVTTALGKMGLTSTQVQGMATNMADVAAKTGGDAMKNLLLSAWK